MRSLTKFLRFHSYASRIGSKFVFNLAELLDVIPGGFHSYASRIGSKLPLVEVDPLLVYSFHSYASRIGSKNSSVKQYLKTDFGFHSYASRIGSKTLNKKSVIDKISIVSIHTLHELEASLTPLQVACMDTDLARVSIHTLHELEASVANRHLESLCYLRFPFIRFTNWKQV